MFFLNKSYFIDAARALMAFLTSDEAGEVFAGYGFTPIKAP